MKHAKNLALALWMVVLPVSCLLPTFSNEVWPILQARCVNCHQPGEAAPMSFTSYDKVRPWSRAIREVVLSSAMPPWHAAPGTAHAFRNDRSMTKTEIATLVTWADAGSPEGKPLPEYRPPAREGGWKLGKPDMVVKIPGFQVPKSGSLPYSFLIVPLHFDRDTWVRAAEFHIDHGAVIHHINAFARAPESSYLAGFPREQIFTPRWPSGAKSAMAKRSSTGANCCWAMNPGIDPRPGWRMARSSSRPVPT